MKKIISSLLLLTFICLEVQAATLSSAISLYKRQNYIGCMNELEDAAKPMFKESDTTLQTLSRNLAKVDPQKISTGSQEEVTKLNDEIKNLVKTNYTDKAKWAYIFYYYALALHQIGLGPRAKEYYNAAFVLTPNSKLGEYSKTAIGCIDNPGSCTGSDMDEFIQSGKEVSDEIIKDRLQKNLEKHREEINTGKDLSSVPKNNQNELLAWADEGINPNIISEVSEIGAEKKTSDIPTDEEIGKAVRTLQKAGINPMGYMNTNMNREYAQLNALLNDGNSQNYNNDYALMMMMNGGNGNGKMSPELMQTIMRQQMMGGYGF